MRSAMFRLLMQCYMRSLGFFPLLAAESLPSLMRRQIPTVGTLPINQEGSLATSYKAIASTWVKAPANKALQPRDVTAASKKLVWWHCSHCGGEFLRRVQDNVAALGACAICLKTPLLPAEAFLPKPVKARPRHPRHQFKLTIKPQTSIRMRAKKKVLRRTRATATPPQRLKSRVIAMPAVAEVLPKPLPPVRVQRTSSQVTKQENRILLPMLAKDFEKERHKISKDETLLLQPKLDGIRCVVAFNKLTKNLIFFSRAGTMFECCDHYIEPALRPLFERDPELVLDGELYNDNNILVKLRQKIAGKKKDREMYRWLDSSADGLCNKKQKEVTFEMLTSAIRTSRMRRTPEVEELQKTLQYHIFDLLYAKNFSPSKHPYTERLEVLKKLIKQAEPQMRRQPARVLRLVPTLRCGLGEVNGVLRALMSIGYEGVMVRRVRTADEKNCGYAYAQRSGTLLKYKKMQDDEFLVVGAVEGKGKLKGSLGAFICRTADTPSRTFTVSPAMPQERKRAVWLRDKAASYKGKMLTVQYQELSSDRVPRFPVGKGVRGSLHKKDWV